MASKHQQISGLYESTIKNVTKNAAAWTAFLRSACRNYKCRFDEQILIYAQRPDATAVLEIEKWNDQFGRWVNRGARGIAVLNNEHSAACLKHYFDISDTHASRFARPVPIWSMRHEYEADVIETLENCFGELSDKETLPDALFSAVKNAVDDNITDYLHQLNDCRRDSFLEELDELNVEVTFRNMLRSSVAYMLLVRCGIDPAEYLDPEDFQGIFDFNTPNTVNTLGIATADIAKMGLREIASTVLDLQKSQNRTVANHERRAQNGRNNIERGSEHGIHIQRGERVQDTRPDSAGRTGDAWQIRKKTPGASEKSQESAVYESTDLRQAGRTPEGDRTDGAGAVRPDNSADGGGAGRDGNTESRESNGMGRPDEQYPPQRGRDDTPRPDLQLTDFPTPEQQIERIEEAEDAAKAESPASLLSGAVPQTVIDGELIRTSGNGFGPRLQTYHYFMENHTDDEAAAFLKQDFGIGSHRSSVDNAFEVEHGGKGLIFTHDASGIKHTLSWKKAVKRIRELIAADRYLTGKDKEIYPKYLGYLKQRAIRREKDRFLDSVAALPPAEKRDTLSMRLADYLNGLQRYEKSYLDPHGIFGLSDPTDAKQINEYLDNPQKTERLISALAAIKGGTSDAFSRNHAWRLGQELEALHTRQYVYRMDDTVYLGTHEYKVMAYDEYEIRLFDPDFPLFNKEMPRADFDAQIAGNELNAHLLTAAEPEPIAELSEPVITPAWEQKKRPARVSYFDAFPHIPMNERCNFRITDDYLGYGGDRTKYRNNIAAIKLLRELESRRRIASPEEQEILSRYVGWGGLPQAFDENRADWGAEYAQLKELLTPEEYTSARATTLNAHYTSPTVIKAIYKTLENIGFRAGNILDPGCGTGNFQGLLPESMAACKVYGIEIDPITGRTAQQLYQKNSIAIQGYENTALPDSFFDIAIGNVPFGAYGVVDKRYDKYKFLIHDYFFAKTLDKVRPGGVIAFITSKGTMDKKNPAVRKYLAQRAELLGAIRLPNNTFLKNAGTEVTTDIIFLQKRERSVDREPEWVNVGQTEDGIPLNNYFLEHPDMVLGEMAFDSGMYGGAKDTTCNPFPDADLAQLLAEAITNIHGEIAEYERDEDEQEDDLSVPADPTVRNFSYTLYDGQIYYRENSLMHPREMSATAQSRVRGMIGLRDCVRTLIEYQTEDYSDYEIRAEQERLNSLYDAFAKKYGLLNDRANALAFDDDSSYPLLCSLEILDEERRLKAKADMFTKRTIRPPVMITHTDTAVEALAVSISEKARVDVEYMAELTGFTAEKVMEDLQSIIFCDIGNPKGDLTSFDPETMKIYEEFPVVTADEYLSGNVREKLQKARHFKEVVGDDFHGINTDLNISALEAVQPADLSAPEISVRLGATWMPPDVIKAFINELLTPSWRVEDKIKVIYSRHTSEWNVTNKSADSDNVKSFNAYGTKRVNAYWIIEHTLNLRDVRVFDTKYDARGKEVRELNKEQTAIAQDKQDLIKQKFIDWIWTDPARRERLCKLYNERFNSIRPRVYDGSHIKFVGMNPEYALDKHQVNAVARYLYGGNALFGHVVGAGKSFSMIASGMEAKRLGLCTKPMYVVPNNIIGDFAGDFFRLYPSANVLMTTEKEFEKKNRKRFCARIATGDYDGIVIGHSQFEKLPMSADWQTWFIERQINEIGIGISQVKEQNGERFTIKQMEKQRKELEARLKRLGDQSRKDDLITFEELGIDALFIDEADLFKNLFFVTKMRNVAGIAQSDAQKASDLFMKTQYLDHRYGEGCICFATGTPVSNTMAEVYTMQKYLQYKTLEEHGLVHFDAWASTFGETVTAMAITPDGLGIRPKTRFANFYNLPELMAMFHEVADIQTKDMLNLPTPKVNYHTEAAKPSDMQTEMVLALGKRADRIYNREVNAAEDNMLLVTNDGRKLALDQRLLNIMLPDFEGSKVNKCVNNVFDIWEKTAPEYLTQLIFCDLSTPGEGRPIEMIPDGDGHFIMGDFQNIYNDIRQKLIIRGIPPEEIAFVHEAKNEMQKKEMFAKVRAGKIRVIIGSTSKMGAGTNIQDKLIALHDLDCPWRPRDLEQRGGRIERRGNKNQEVHIYRYVTEGTFDSYLYQMIEHKQRPISQVFTSKSPARIMQEIDEVALSYAEIKALATGNPLIMEHCTLTAEVGRLYTLQSSYMSQRYELEDRLLKSYPAEIKHLEEQIAGYAADAEKIGAVILKDGYPMEIKGVHYPAAERRAAGSAILAACRDMTSPGPVRVGCYRGFDMELSYEPFNKEYRMALKGTLSHQVQLGIDIFGNITRIDNALEGLSGRLKECEEQLVSVRAQTAEAQAQIQVPFAYKQELADKTARLAELTIALKMKDKERQIVDAAPDEGDAGPERKARGRDEAR